MRTAKVIEQEPATQGFGSISHSGLRGSAPRSAVSRRSSVVGLSPTPRRFPLYADQALSDRPAFMLEHLEKFVHVLFAVRSKGIDAKPGLSFQFRGRYPEAAALLDAFRNFGMQFLGLRFAEAGFL